MGIIHSAVRAVGDLPTDKYAVIPNELIDDNSLSPLARLLGIWLRSRPERWTTNERAICLAMGVKDRRTVRAALQELYKSGWARLDTNNTDDGHIYQYVYLTLRNGRFRRKKERTLAVVNDAWG